MLSHVTTILVLVQLAHAVCNYNQLHKHNSFSHGSSSRSNGTREKMSSLCYTEVKMRFWLIPACHQHLLRNHHHWKPLPQLIIPVHQHAGSKSNCTCMHDPFLDAIFAGLDTAVVGISSLSDSPNIGACTSYWLHILALISTLLLGLQYIWLILTIIIKTQSVCMVIRHTKTMSSALRAEEPPQPRNCVQDWKW